ncbi:MAG: helix-turn-helix transcriptional regulator [Ruminococcaceae bacterium]|nr:helix-turn-helix transcriptional regulator [Oscillospiraceae bacterium]
MKPERFKQIDIQLDTNLRIPFWKEQIEKLWIIERTDTDRGYVMDEHVHQFFELLINYYPVPLRHTVAGNAYDTDTPFIQFRAPYILHSTSALDFTPYTRTNIAFHPLVLAEFGGICKLGKLANCQECVIPTTTEKIMTLEPLLTRLRRVRDPNVPKHVWISALSMLIWEISEMAENAIVHGAETSPYIQELLQYTVEHAEEDLSIDTLAEHFFVSRNKLTRDFRAAVHMSLHEYITEVRIHRAKILLMEGLPLSVIAERCGFSGDSSFVYMFRSHTGMTPGEYRKRGVASNLPKRSI